MHINELTLMEIFMCACEFFFFFFFRDNIIHEIVIVFNNNITI
jgi:hypothetical protein